MTYAHATVLARKRSPRRPPPAGTVLASIRVAEYLGRVPWREWLERQPCELTR